MIPEIQNPFRSFWMAGFECTDKLNCFGDRVDFLKVTGHLEKMHEDYQNLSLFNIKTVREGIRWSQVERSPYQYDWSDLRKMIETARQNDIQQVWDLCHFGFPDDLSPLHPMFARRFASMCRAFVKFYRSVEPSATLIVTPINEVSFLSWLGGDVRGTSPYCKGYGWEVKYSLMRAYIEGIEAMLAEDSSVRIMTTEPLVNMVAPLDATQEEVTAAARQHEDQFQVLEILRGAMCPELQGKPEYIDIIGCNFYFNNQWIINTCEFIPWNNEGNDPRWLSVGELMTQVYERYKVPVVLSETSHPGEHRPLWMKYIAEACNNMLLENIPLLGICWYPIIDRPDWDHMQPWHKAGIWDVIQHANGDLERVLDSDTASALLEAQALLEHSGKMTA
jgi:hypothetical protein